MPVIICKPEQVPAKIAEIEARGEVAVGVIQTDHQVQIVTAAKARMLPLLRNVEYRTGLPPGHREGCCPQCGSPVGHLADCFAAPKGAPA